MPGPNPPPMPRPPNQSFSCGMPTPLDTLPPMTSASFAPCAISRVCAVREVVRRQAAASASPAALTSIRWNPARPPRPPPCACACDPRIEGRPPFCAGRAGAGAGGCAAALVGAGAVLGASLGASAGFASAAAGGFSDALSSARRAA